MANPQDLTLDELAEGLRQTGQAIQRGQEIVDKARSAENLTLGWSKVIESIPKLIDELQQELAALKERLADNQSQ